MERSSRPAILISGGAGSFLTTTILLIFSFGCNAGDVGFSMPAETSAAAGSGSEFIISAVGRGCSVVSEISDAGSSVPISISRGI